MNYDNLKAIFDLGRPITKDDKFPYIHLAYKNNLDNYRLITSGELFVRGRGLEIPQYLVQYMSFHNEALMMANIISDKIINITFRSINTNKEFMKVGNMKSIFYGLGKLSKDFKYGDTILLVEGHLDRDMMATIFPNTLGVMTSHLSKSQVELLRGLTNKVILMLDNDEAGRKGQYYAKKQLTNFKVSELEHDISLKDAGDLVKLDITNHSKFEDIILMYKLKLEMIA